jgi:hypothetical protein
VKGPIEETPVLMTVASMAMSRAHRAGTVSLDRDIPGDPDLTMEERTRLGNLIDEVYAQPVLAPAELIRVLEGLLAKPDLSHGAVYEALEVHHSLLMHRIAHRAYQAGLAASRAQEGPAAGDPVPPEGPDEQ